MQLRDIDLMNSFEFDLDDYVRVSDSGINAFRIGQITNVDRESVFPFFVEFINGADAEYFNADELIPWEPKPGEMVMFVNNVDRMDLTGKSGIVYLGRRDGMYVEHALDVVVDDFTEGHDGDANDDSTNHVYCGVNDVIPLAFINNTDDDNDAGMLVHAPGGVLVEAIGGGDYLISFRN